MPAFTTAHASELLEPGLKSIFLNRFMRFPEEYSQLLNVLSSSRNFEEDLTFAGFGPVPEKNEGQAVTFEDPLQGNVKRISMKEFALGFRITRPMWMDDQYGKMKTLTSALAVAFGHLAEVQGASLYNNATSTTAEFLLADGKALAATDHPLLKGGTFSNLATADLSYVEVQNAYTAFEELTDHASLPIRIVPKRLITTPTFRFVAEEIFKQEAKPNTADRDDNTISNKSIDMFVSHYITDSDLWVLQSNPAVDGDAGHSLQFIWREKPIFETYDDKDTKDIKVNGYARLGVGATEPFGIYVSTGG